MDNDNQQQDNTGIDATQLPAQTEEDEWTGATAEYLMDKNGTQPKEAGDANGDKRVQTNQNADANAGSDDSGAEAGQKGAVSNDSKKVGDDGTGKDGEEDGDSSNGQATGSEEDADDDSVGNQQPTRAELEADRKQTVEEIRKELLSDMPTRLEDADGEPIETIEDVMKLLNPRTGKAFTETEAAAWLLAAQQHLNKQIKEAEDRVEQVAEVHLTLKDKALNIRNKYGALLEANPNGIRDKVYAAYQKTLVKDKDSDLIIDAPVDMEEFYDIALEPYERLAARLEAEAEQGIQQSAAQQNPQQQRQVQQQKQNARSDRQDIVGGGKINTKDPEEAEWEKAAKAYYEG